MAQLGQAWVTLGTRDQDLRRGLNDAQRLVNQKISSMQSSLRSLTIGAGIAGGIAGLTAGFRAGIKAVDDYKLATIGIAATLTDMAKKGSGDLQAIYQNNVAYAEDTYRRVELAAAKFFASGEEMVQAWQILTQKGTVITSKEDIDNLGVIVDKIKLATQGQTSSLQIAQEIRAVMNGQAKATDQIAMYLRDRIGPEWEKQLAKAREEGKVLEFLAKQFQGLKYASADVSNTLESQLSTMQTLAKQVGRQGLAGAYSDIVGVLQSINQYVEEHAELLASSITKSWNTVKGILTDAELNKFVSVTIGEGARQARDLGAAMVGLLGTARQMLSLFNSLPDYVTGPAGLGIIGALVFGGKGGAVIGMVAAINNGMNQLGMGIQGLIQNYRGAVESFQKIEDVITGKRDMNTGEIIVPPGVIRKPIPKPEAQEILPKAPTYTTPQIEAPKIQIEIPKAAAAARVPKILELDDIDKQIMSAQKSIMDSFQMITDADAAMKEKMAENSGDFIKADSIRWNQWAEKAKEDFLQRVQAEEQAYIELQQRLAAAEGGVTPEASAALETLRQSVEALKNEIPAYNDLIDETAKKEKQWANESRNLQGAIDLAEVSLQYADLTGNMQQAYQAQIALIEASKAEKLANIDKNIPGLAEAYSRLYDEQARIARLMSSSNFFGGFIEGLKDSTNGIHTLAELGKSVAQDFSSGMGSIFKSLIKGTDDLKEKLMNMLDSLADKFTDLAMNMFFQGLFGAGGGFGGGPFFGLFGRAAGGPVSYGTPYLVGEKGPELFVPSSYGSIMSTSQLLQTIASRETAPGHTISIDVGGISIAADGSFKSGRLENRLRGEIEGTVKRVLREELR